MSAIRISKRDIPPRAAWALEQGGLHPLLAQLYAARGVQHLDAVSTEFKNLLPPQGMKGIEEGVALLLGALDAQKSLCIVADYDCDGATACSVAVRGLKMLGLSAVDYLVPDRARDGYGLTPALSERVAQTGAQILMTVDNGVASVEGVARAKELGLEVLITDHHLPGETLPQADALINPNQPACAFASKNLAGVGVVFYLLLALRTALRQAGRWTQESQPRLDTLLPLVALGTVADVVPLDSNNRILVAQGLRRIRAGAMPAGMRALFDVAKRPIADASTTSMGFALGPRINAAGRLSDMRIGIECLLCDDPSRAAELATQLDNINRERQEVEGGMREHALQIAEHLFDEAETPPAALSVFDPDFHEGVVGIVAARLKERWHRPTFVFAPSGAEGQEHILKGSGRSIEGLHLRDALDWVAKKHPGLLLKFGGHAMAAGCSIEEENFELFEEAFASVCAAWLDRDTLQRKLATDGPLSPEYRRPDVAQLLEAQVWGQGFPAPTFSEPLSVVSQRPVGEGKHLALKLKSGPDLIDAIWFGRTEPIRAAQATFAYRLAADEWQGRARLKYLIQGCEQE